MPPPLTLASIAVPPDSTIATPPDMTTIPLLVWPEATTSVLPGLTINMPQPCRAILTDPARPFTAKGVTMVVRAVCKLSRFWWVHPPPSPPTAITVSFSGRLCLATSTSGLSGQMKSGSSGASRPMKRSSWLRPQ
jgi:hypothetical protein